MTTRVLIDGDLIAYRCAASCLKQGQTVEPLDVAQMRVNDLMYRIVQETEATSYNVYIGGTDNFRLSIYPKYKANRDPKAKPQWLEGCREQLLVEWGGWIVNGMETDDKLGMEQYASFSNPLRNGGEETVIASIDKDLLMIPGRHYNFVKQEFYNVSEHDGIKHFWFQMIMGDRVDNIPGYDGIMRATVPKFLAPKITELNECKTPEEMEALVKEMYTDQEQFEINKKLIWICRSIDDLPISNVPEEPSGFDEEDWDYFGGNTE